MIAVAWILGISLAAALFLLAVSVGGNRDLAAENRKIRKDNRDLVFENLDLSIRNAQMRRAHIELLARVGIDAVDTTDLTEANTPADIHWGGEQ